MSKLDQMILFMAIEDVRDQLKHCESQLALAECHMRLVSLYACIDTDALIDTLADSQNKSGVA